MKKSDLLPPAAAEKFRNRITELIEKNQKLQREIAKKQEKINDNETAIFIFSRFIEFYDNQEDD